MTQFDYLSSRETADRLVKRFGMAAILRRATDTPTDRPCWIVVLDHMTQEQPTRLVNVDDRRILISPIGLDAKPPDNEQDQLVILGQPLSDPPIEIAVLPFTKSAKPIAPAGITVLYEIIVRDWVSL